MSKILVCGSLLKVYSFFLKRLVIFFLNFTLHRKYFTLELSLLQQKILISLRKNWDAKRFLFFFLSDMYMDSPYFSLKWTSIGCRESRHNVPHTLPLWFCLEIDNRVGFLWKLKLMYFRCHRIFSFYSLWVNLIESAIFSNFTIEHLWPPSKVHFLRALLGTKFSWMFVMSVWAC